ncbi:hypothetical protein BO94DRAFT_588624 [Aspergillus sclerotioniger CBS 115572]|uniref:Uncharacterized protein n=1 Tax=Aspergillus sclerotioniger CBS 115572 TaxID=1450535 RepID=A0A317VVA9_9EURO|nr:hypothetical protein BO94DRAFT_588624 [Aspergillus sclerotioniger CBS 115572]PWY77291.1 hypothetical protein BO94DRAFT_588624 [Aspergillus sclerotioniger CBS 115572]
MIVLGYNYTFYGNSRHRIALSYTLASEVSGILRHHEIPCMLIGDLLFRVLGYKGSNKHLDLAVEDFHLEQAIAILRDNGYDDSFHQKCTTIDEERQKQYEAHMKPAHWFHLYDRTPVHSYRLTGHDFSIPLQSTAKEHVDLRLYRMSEYFWVLPNIPLAVDWVPNDRNYIQTDDPRLPVRAPHKEPDFGAFPPHIPAVIMPSPARVIEAIIWLKARDSKLCCRGRCWNLMFAYVMYIGRKANYVDIPPPISGPLYDIDAFEQVFHEWWRSEMESQCMRSVDLLRELETVLQRYTPGNGSK